MYHLFCRGYCVRSQAVSVCISEFLQDTQGYEYRQVVSLGCGFDSLYFRLRAELGSPMELCVWEVDFPPVVQRKRHVIEQTETLRNLLDSCETPPSNGHVVLSAGQYKLLGVDLSDTVLLDCVLEQSGLRWDCPTLILGEVVLCYMDPAQSTSLIGWASERFTDARFVLYEQCFPDDPFGQVMMSHFLSLNSPLRSVATFPRIQDQEKRFLQKGWSRCRVLDMNQFSLSCVPVSERLRIEALEPFDEFEELHLKCSHYFILVASRGSLSETNTLRPVSDTCAEFQVLSPPVPQGCLQVSSLPVALQGLQRFGHRSCPLSPHLIVTTGGFGEKNGKHQRLSDIHVLLHRQEGWERLETVSGWGQSYVFVFGGRSVSLMALQDTVFLRSQDLSRIQLPVSGSTPSARHSHSSCPWNGGAVISGGLLLSGVPSGLVTLLRPRDTHFEWEELETVPPVTPRYSLTPLVTLCIQSVLEWPLMLHSHSSVLLPEENQLLLLGGGGNCFSFGSHLNPQPLLLQLPPTL
ncbi:tRNA wybutosine-synthesizing protein 4 [Rhinophrynus dorsalis]